MRIERQIQRSVFLPVVCGALLIAGGLPAVAAADDEPGLAPKLKRQIRLMETVIDETLLDSPYLLVFSNSPTQGIYLGDYGVIFTLEASLVSDGLFFGGPEAFTVLRNIRIGTEDGRVVILSDDSDDEDDSLRRLRERLRERDEDEDAEADREDEDEWDDEEGDDIIIDFYGADGKSLRELREDQEERARESYEEGKQELIDVLIGYGDSMTRLEDDQWVVIAAFLQQDDFFEEQGLSRLILKARMSDLRAFGRERISAEEMTGRVVIEEY
jgi:hypothetical protein